MDDETTEQQIPDTPVVSLIVPMYNVQQYLADCLDSILSQGLSPIQVILVDDGSTDGTAAIANRYAEEHPCVEYHRIDNQGLGHARNYGATFARGMWLMFPDSDDELAPHALRDLVALGENYDCDIVTGDVDRFDSTREWPNPLHRTAFHGVPEACHITASPSLLYDHTAWNKLFRREFFERERLSWVEGHLYEDMPCSTPAHCLAGSVAHLDQVVYRWRERDGGGPSITQRRTEPANFRDRMHAIRLVDEFFEDHELPDELRLAKDAKWLTLDIPIYLDVLPEGDEAYRREVVEAVASYLERIDPHAWGMTPSAERIKCRLAQRRDVDGLVRFVRWQREAGDTLRVTRKRGRLYGSYPATGLSESDRDMTAELARDGLYTDVKRVELEGGSLRIDASALVPRLSQKRPSLAARLVRADGKAALDLDVEGASSSRPLEVRVSAAYHSVAVRWQPQRDWMLQASADSLATLPPGDYHVELSWSDAGLSCDPSRLAHPLTGHGPRPYPVRSGESVLVVAYGPGEELTLRVLEDRNPITRVAFDGDALVTTLTDGSSTRTTLPGPTEAAAVTAAELEGVPYASEPQLITREGDDAEDLWLVSASQSGNVSATRLGPSVRLDGCAVENTTINLRVSWPYSVPAPSEPTLWLVGREHGARTALDTAPDGEGAWIASLDLSDPSSTKALRDDEYRLSLGSEGGGTRYHVVGGADRRSTRLNSGGYSYELDMMGAEPLLRVAHERTWDEGRLRQLAVERVAYPIMRLLPLRRDLVLFESFWATSVGCSPKALYDYIDNEHDEYRCIWSVRDTRIPVDGRAEVVRQGSFGYYLALARAGFLVSNVNFPEYYVKRRGQVEVQTMHGTPLKTMGIDVRSEIPNKEAADRLLSICSRWDYLVVQSRRVEEITRRCFGFEKTFLRTGYPRNDSLLRRNDPEEQRRLKERMGIDPDSRLVLYAPTWRARGRFDLELDIAKLERDFGGHYQFAIRRHYMAVPRMSGGEKLGGAIDLTYGWSVDDCMLAADVVVTDYSSIMFDYALLGRPMLFYCYDLESYRDDLRGLYVDFESEAPGPILRTTADVADALAGIEDVRKRYRERYEAFVSGFLEYESDHSSRDVFEQVFAR